MDEEKPEGVENESVEQVCFADRLLLNKVDLVSEEDLARVEKVRARPGHAVAPELLTDPSACHGSGCAIATSTRR